ncbi:MAG: energy-coupling factor transporter ATPase [Tissierellia bacterium]|nr:energy-coupling factor transporter ATPase [Tissierellia bacterium]
MKVRDLNLQIGDKLILKNLNFDLPLGKITLLKGKSGVGKSSLLKVLAGIIPNTIDGEASGSIQFHGGDILGQKTEVLAGQIAYMAQDPESQLCSFTVEGEIIFALENILCPVDEIMTRVDEVLSLLQISHLKHKRLNHLSGGEQQKVTLASLLVLGADLFILDEPTANLDPKSTIEMLSLIERLSKEMGRTVLIIEHKLSEVIGMVDQVLELTEDGIKTVDRDFLAQRLKTDSQFPHRRFFEGEHDVVLSIEKISFGYEDSPEIFRNLDFSINRGEIVGITGLNGAGKSTLAKLIAGLLKPNKGQILLKGHNTTRISHKKLGRLIGLVFQNPEHQFIKFRTEDEISISLTLLQLDKDEVKRKTEEYLKMFDLINEKENNPFTLSQGQKRRLSTASMIINEQELLLLDEPTYGQDRENLLRLIELLYEINRKGMTILMITHDKELIKKACDRIIYLENGQIAYVGPPEGFHAYDIY